MKNCVLTILVLLSPIPAFVHHDANGQEAAQEAAKVRPARTDGERKFVGMIPRLKRAETSRRQMANDSSDQLANATRRLSVAAGRDYFVEQVMGLESKSLMVSDSKRHARWVRELYVKYVFSHDKLKELIAAASRSLERRHSDITDQVLVDLLVDIELPSKSVTWPTIDDRKIGAAVDAEVALILDEIDSATGKQIAAFFSGLAGGEIARQASREAMKDEHGNVGLLGEILSWVIDAGVSYVVDGAVNELAETEKTLRQQVDNSVTSLTERLLNNDRKTIDALFTEWSSLSATHYHASHTAVYRSLGIDPAWARATYEAASKGK